MMCLSKVTPYHIALILLVCVILEGAAGFRPNSSQKASLSKQTRLPFSIPRGGDSGSVAFGDDDEDEDEEEDVEQEEGEAEDESEESENPISAAIPSAPVSITFKTNLGNKLVDTSLELLVTRTRNVESVKGTLSKMLPGRPPAGSLRIISDGVLLEDDQLIDELVDDDDDDEDDEEEEEGDKSSMTMTLDIVPPVDAKFATELDLIHDMTNSELLDAYTANAASMYHNGQSIFSQEQEGSSLSLQLRQQAHDIRQQLESSFPERAAQLLADDVAPSALAERVIEERRGQRYRSGRGGAKTNMRRVIQKNLNIVSNGKFEIRFSSIGFD